jgi:multiple antibiotic resistance protein
MKYFDTKFCLQVFVTLVVIMDPLGNVPIFLALTAAQPARAKRTLAWQSVTVAGIVIGVFALFGQQILGYLGISVPALQASGGLLLLLVALQLLTDQEQVPSSIDEVNVALVPLGTPLIAGPGAIAATIVFVRQAHGVRDALAITVALLAVLIVLWLALRGSLVVLKVLRVGGIHILTRIFGLLLSAIAVQLVAEGVRGFVVAGH